MEDVKKDKAQQQAQTKKENVLGQGGTLSDAELGKVTGGAKAGTEFEPQPDPPGRHG